MIAAIRKIVVPTIRELEFSGSFPNFHRIRETQIDLLAFQFFSYGGSFIVEIAYCPPEGLTTADGKHFPPKKVRIYHIHLKNRLRLGAFPPLTDHWFSYEPERAGIYEDTALDVLPFLRSQAESFWRTHERMIVPVK